MSIRKNDEEELQQYERGEGELDNFSFLQGDLDQSSLDEDWFLIEECDTKNGDSRGFNDLNIPQKKKSTFGSLFKNRVYYSLYNMYHSKLTEPPKFSNGPIWLLGNEYLIKNKIKLRDSGHILSDHAQRFLSDFPKIIYFCYRKDFPRIQTYNTSTDIGWGCMARTGQMILALSILKISGFQISDRSNHVMSLYLIDDKRDSPEYLTHLKDRISIISLFSDYPEPRSDHPFGIHQIVEQNFIMHGWNSKHEFWFTPTKISHVLKSLVNIHFHNFLDIYVANDGIMYEDKILKRDTVDGNMGDVEMIYPHDPPPNSFKPILILLPIRLGVDKLNIVYINHLKAILRSPYTVGIIGGKPNKSMFFVGYQDDHIFYLDPHFVDTAIESSKIKEHIESFSIKYPHKIKFEEMDPSMAIGFLIQSKEDYENFKREQKELKQNKITTTFCLLKQTPDYLEEVEEC